MTDRRIFACLKGIAAGDAIGKQTETLTREDVLRWYPDGIRGFEGVPGTPIPRYVGNRKREWLIGETTDDTERTIAVARAVIRNGQVDHTAIGRELLACRKCVHPGIQSLWEFHQAGDPARVADRHDGCGAAIRVAPVGILYGSSRLSELVEAAREASIPTHGGRLAIAAAAATAAAVSAAVDGLPPEGIIETAQSAAATYESVFSDAVRTVHRELHQMSDLHPAAIAAKCFPNSPLTIVPLALALGTIAASAERAILLAANVGGDSDSVASIAVGIAAARRPDTLPDEWCAVVEAVNGHDLGSLGRALTALRR